MQFVTLSIIIIFNVKPLDGLDFFGESYYFQGEYRFTPKWVGLLRYDALFTDRSDRDGSHWVALNPTARNGLEHSRFAKDITSWGCVECYAAIYAPC